MRYRDQVRFKSGRLEPCSERRLRLVEDSRTAPDVRNLTPIERETDYVTGQRG
jgi:hypothetical protein